MGSFGLTVLARSPVKTLVLTAQRVVRELLAGQPNASIELIKTGDPFRQVLAFNRFVEALRQEGLPREVVGGPSSQESANGMVRPCCCPASKLARGAKDKEHVMFADMAPHDFHNGRTAALCLSAPEEMAQELPFATNSFRSLRAVLPGGHQRDFDDHAVAVRDALARAASQS